MISQDKVRLRAFELWETEGRPHGRDVEHWLRAEAEIHGQAVLPAAAGKPIPPAAGKTNGRKPSARKTAKASAKV